MRGSSLTPSSGIVPLLKASRSGVIVRSRPYSLNSCSSHRRDRLVLHLLQRPRHRGHLGDRRHQHVDVFVDCRRRLNGFRQMVDIGLELDVTARRPCGRASRRSGRGPASSTCGVDGAVGPGHLVHQHRLAGAGRADDGEVVVAQVVVVESSVISWPRRPPNSSVGVRVPRHSAISGARWIALAIGLARDAAHLGQVGVEAFGQRHRQAGQQRLPVHVDVGVELEAAARARSRCAVSCGGDGRSGVREERELVVQARPDLPPLSMASARPRSSPAASCRRPA